ncbi:TLC domain-containing protein [Entophlyctis helioformis]|nr:TLC domain-containing protein [Entophlyctis helioformis]
MSATTWEMLGVKHLETHFWQMVLAAVACQTLMVVGGMLSQASPFYTKLSPIKRASWRIHIVSSAVTATIPLLAAPLFFTKELADDKLFGYTYYAGVVYAIACGYFLWDTLVSLYYIQESGIGFVVHGLACFTVFTFSFRPFLQYYGSVFLMFEISTIFLNIHWFCDKTGLTGSRLQWINGMILLAAFFFVRIVFGLYQSGHFFYTCFQRWEEVPVHMFLLYAVANVILNGLNLFWFTRMISSVTSRFKGKVDAHEDGGYGRISSGTKAATPNKIKEE